MPSFDVVSKINQSEVDNALMQTTKEIGTRFDFRGTNTSIERIPEGIQIIAISEARIEAALEVFQSKLTRRGVSLSTSTRRRSSPRRAATAGSSSS